MARKRGRKTVKQVASPPEPDLNVADDKEPQIEKQEAQFTDPDVERQISAIRAIRDVEIEHLLTELRLLRSYFTKEQLHTPLLQFFKDNYQNLSIVSNGENGQMEVQWLDKDGNVSMNDGIDLHQTLFRRLSMAYSGCSAAIPPLGGFEFSSKAERTSILGADNLQIRDFVSEEPFDSLMLGKQDTLQTPGVSSQRLSIRMTPKTVRFPKPGRCFYLSMAHLSVFTRKTTWKPYMSRKRDEWLQIARVVNHDSRLCITCQTKVL